MKADPDLVLKVHSLLAESNPAVLAYAALLGDEHVIKEYLKNFPNEVFNCKLDISTLWAGGILHIRFLMGFTETSQRLYHKINTCSVMILALLNQIKEKFTGSFHLVM